MRRPTVRFATLVVLEAAVIFMAIAVAAYIRLGERGGRTASDTEPGSIKTLLVVVVAQVCLYYADLYNVRVVSDRRELFTRLVQAIATVSFALAAIYYWFPALVIGRGVSIIAASLAIPLITTWRLAFEWLSDQ